MVYVYILFTNNLISCALTKDVLQKVNIKQITYHLFTSLNEYLIFNEELIIKFWIAGMGITNFKITFSLIMKHYSIKGRLDRFRPFERVSSVVYYILGLFKQRK